MVSPGQRGGRPAMSEQAARGPVVAVVGPTASGKSSLAEAVALRLGTSVVSVDAMQVYRGMDVGTAKTPPARRRVPLLMVDVCDVGESYSAERFQGEARRCVDGLLAKDGVAVLCGGTGLYLDAVIDDMDFPSGSDEDDRRRQLEEHAREVGAEALHAELAALDPESAAAIHPHNVRRVVRALELHEQGLSYARQREGLRSRAAHYDATLWGISRPRGALYARIDSRVDEMFEDGLVAEVEALRARGLEGSHTASQAIGYREVLDALDGRISFDEARERMKVRTRHYAKRQLSWLRRDGRVRWLDGQTMGEREMVDVVCADERGRGRP